ncbi:50S ribosomal protein L18 [Patescibacteria group bacterium]|nr:50S ribosomal protein L18 [Patescibacteria group bacterium]MBU1890347.1 50S ribosomal protein L18 [Patescibacteria group bacterium]
MTSLQKKKVIGRQRRRIRVRAKVMGTSARPRMCVFRSLKHIYVQLIDDQKGRTLVSVSDESLDKSLKGSKAAEAVGLSVSKKALANKITQVVFDRSGYKYHGRVKALAEATRKGGLKF